MYKVAEWKKGMRLVVDFDIFAGQNQKVKTARFIATRNITSAEWAGNPTNQVEERIPKKEMLRCSQQHGGGKISSPMCRPVRQGSSLQRFPLAAKLTQL